jgi:hypothetical protein
MVIVNNLAESEGFEPSIRFWRIHTFQACAFDHSANSPLHHSLMGLQILQINSNYQNLFAFTSICL